MGRRSFVWMITSAQGAHLDDRLVGGKTGVGAPQCGQMKMPPSANHSLQSATTPMTSPKFDYAVTALAQ